MKGAKSKAWDWTKWSFHVWSTYYASKCCESMKLAQKCRVDTCSRTLWTSLDGSIGWCWSTAEVVKWIDVAQTPAKLQYFATSPRSQNHEWLNTALDPQTIRNKWWWVSPNNQVLCRVSSWFFTSIGFFREPTMISGWELGWCHKVRGVMAEPMLLLGTELGVSIGHVWGRVAWLPVVCPLI